MKYINVLGINLDIIKKHQVLKQVLEFLNSNQLHQIVTPNPEFLLTARRDEEFFYILNHAALAIPDGIGLKFMSWLSGNNIYRYSGADLAQKILEISQEKNVTVGIANLQDGLSSAADIKQALKNKYPNLNLVVADLKKEDHDYSAFKNVPILFCTFGAPEQDKYIYHSLINLPQLRIGMGIGGALDFVTKKIDRAPKIMRLLGIEWLWRLIQQPRRIKRIFNAVVIFPIIFVLWKFILRFFYRPNVACLVYKKTAGQIKILLVERTGIPDSWQLPQGGTDGESPKIAGLRELREELNTDKFRSVAVFKNIYKYLFKKPVKNLRNPDGFMGYKGQKQSLLVVEFLGADSDIQINFWDHQNWKWVEASSALDAICDYKKNRSVIFLEKFKSLKI